MILDTGRDEEGYWARSRGDREKVLIPILLLC
jgi:hypothetical protein